MIIDIILFLAMWATGSLIFSFIGMQVILSVFTAIPLTHEFKKVGAIDSKKAYQRIAFTIILDGSICAAVSIAVITFATYTMKFGFIAGCAFACILSLGKWSWHVQGNFDDFVSSFGRLIDQKFMDEKMNQQKS